MHQKKSKDKDFLENVIDDLSISLLVYLCACLCTVSRSEWSFSWVRRRLIRTMCRNVSLHIRMKEQEQRYRWKSFSHDWKYIVMMELSGDNGDQLWWPFEQTIHVSGSWSCPQNLWGRGFNACDQEWCICFWRLLNTGLAWLANILFTLCRTPGWGTNHRCQCNRKVTIYSLLPKKSSFYHFFPLYFFFMIIDLENTRWCGGFLSNNKSYKKMKTWNFFLEFEMGNRLLMVSDGSIQIWKIFGLPVYGGGGSISSPPKKS